MHLFTKSTVYAALCSSYQYNGKVERSHRKDKEGDFDYYCNMEMVELSLIEDSTTRKELHELIRKHYHFTGSHLASKMLDNWNKYVDEFIQIVPIEYKKVLQEEQMKKLQKKSLKCSATTKRQGYVPGK